MPRPRARSRTPSVTWTWADRVSQQCDCLNDSFPVNNEIPWVEIDRDAPFR